MIRQSGIREKIRSNVLKDLAKEKTSKRPKFDEKQTEYSDESDTDRIEEERSRAKARKTNNSLLSILPEPKNSSAFGPSIKLDKLLKAQERADEHGNIGSAQTSNKEVNLTDDGMMVVDISKFVEDTKPNLVKELTIVQPNPSGVVVPKGKEKQKNQITYLAQLGKANELERQEQAAQGRINKSAARSKYGW